MTSYQRTVVMFTLIVTVLLSGCVFTTPTDEATPNVTNPNETVPNKTNSSETTSDGTAQNETSKTETQPTPSPVIDSDRDECGWDGREFLYSYAKTNQSQAEANFSNLTDPQQEFVQSRLLNFGGPFDDRDDIPAWVPETLRKNETVYKLQSNTIRAEAVWECPPNSTSPPPY